MEETSRLSLPDDTVIYTHRHGRDLYVAYVRQVLRIPDYEGGNTKPEDAHTIEMADYYSYEYPMLIDDIHGNLWCHIGGRLFKWEDGACRWAEKARFFADSLVKVDGDVFVFANHLQQDENPAGTKAFNTITNTLEPETQAG